MNLYSVGLSAMMELGGDYDAAAANDDEVQS